MSKSKIIDGWIISTFFVIVIIIAVNIPYTTAEPYTDKEYYTEQEPYTANETYFIKEAYTENVSLNLSTKVDWYIVDYIFYDKFDFKAILRNTDNLAGRFWVTFRVESTKGSYEFTTDSVFLRPGESYQIIKTFDGRFSYAAFRVHQPTKEVKKYRDIPEEKTITAYRDVDKSRDVVKLKETRLSFLERLLK